MRAIRKEIMPQGGTSFLCEERRYPTLRFYWHYHREIELTLVVRGRGRRFVGDSIADYREGDLVMLGANLPHAYCSRTDDPKLQQQQRHVVIQFPASMLDAFLCLPEATGLNALIQRGGRGLCFRGRCRNEAADIIVSMQRMAAADRLLALLSVLHGLARTDRSVPLASEGFTPSLRGKTNGVIGVICKHINEHFTTPVHHADLAKLVGMRPDAFSRFFRRTMGKTVTDYINELRTGMACRLLLESDLTVAQVCYRVGFNNFSNFARQFRKRKGMTPAKFRSKYRADEG